MQNMVNVTATGPYPCSCTAASGPQFALLSTARHQNEMGFSVMPGTMLDGGEYGGHAAFFGAACRGVGVYEMVGLFASG